MVIWKFVPASQGAELLRRREFGSAPEPGVNVKVPMLAACEETAPTAMPATVESVAMPTANGRRILRFMVFLLFEEPRWEERRELLSWSEGLGQLWLVVLPQFGLVAKP